MRFLVIGRAVDYAGPFNPSDFAMVQENIILPSLEMLKNWEKDKKTVGGLLAGQRAGAIIIEASSAEELSNWLTGLPAWGLNTWEVMPLQTFQSGIDDLKRQMANVKKMGQMMPPQE